MFPSYVVIIICTFVQVPALTTSASRSNPFVLTVALCSQGQAKGELFWDDGDSLDTFERGDYSYVSFMAEQVGLFLNLKWYVIYIMNLGVWAQKNVVSSIPWIARKPLFKASTK